MKGKTSSVPKYIVLTGFVVTLLILCLAWYFFVDSVGGSLSRSGSDWAYFGSFIGGVGSAIAPILSAASILFVWWQSKETSVNQQKQLSKLNEHTVNQQKQLSKLNEHTENQQKQLSKLSEHTQNQQKQLDLLKRQIEFEAVASLVNCYTIYTSRLFSTIDSSVLLSGNVHCGIKKDAL